jgi:hypothetical protein
LGEKIINYIFFNIEKYYKYINLVFLTLIMIEDINDC